MDTCVCVADYQIQCSLQLGAVAPCHRLVLTRATRCAWVLGTCTGAIGWCSLEPRWCHTLALTRATRCAWVLSSCSGPYCRCCICTQIPLQVSGICAQYPGENGEVLVYLRQLFRSIPFVCAVCLSCGCLRSCLLSAETEEHCRGPCLLDGQRVGAAQLHQAGPRPQSDHIGCTGRPGTLGTDGL